MRYILIPVKDLTHAKQRLGSLLSQAERTRLAQAMLETTLAAAAAVHKADRIALVTLYPPAIALARRHGIEVILETTQISESASVDFGSREAQKRGARSLLRLPIDLPLISTEDIEAILDQEKEDIPVVVVPSRDGTGTNALLRRPPDLFPSHFGPGSLNKHLREASQRGVHCEVLRLERIAFDIDDPPDLADLLKLGPPTTLEGLLAEMRVAERLEKTGRRNDLPL